MLDPLPLGQGFARVGHDAVAEDMRMATDHLVRKPVEDIRHGELAKLAGDLAVKHHLKQQVAQLFDQMVPRTLVDGLEHLVGFFEEVGLQRRACLLAVPRATAVTPEASHEREKGIEAVGTGVGHE